jgi:hypothetical protein
LPGAVVEALSNHFDGIDSNAVELPAEEPLCFASFAAGERVEIFLEPRSVGAALPVVPVFLAEGRYIDLPLADSYDRAWLDTPRVWRDVLQPAG